MVHLVVAMDPPLPDLHLHGCADLPTKKTCGRAFDETDHDVGKKMSDAGETQVGFRHWAYLHELCDHVDRRLDR